MLSQLRRVRRQEIRVLPHDSRPVSGAVIFSRTGVLVREAMKSLNVKSVLTPCLLIVNTGELKGGENERAGR